MKIPKPTYFYKQLIIKDTIPTPHAFFEETNYYILVWKKPIFTFGNISTTYIDVSYEIVPSTSLFFGWTTEQVISAMISHIITFIMGFGLGKRYGKK